MSTKGPMPSACSQSASKRPLPLVGGGEWSLLACAQVRQPRSSPASPESLASEAVVLMCRWSMPADMLVSPRPAAHTMKQVGPGDALRMSMTLSANDPMSLSARTEAGTCIHRNWRRLSPHLLQCVLFAGKPSMLLDFYVATHGFGCP